MSNAVAILALLAAALHGSRQWLPAPARRFAAALACLSVVGFALLGVIWPSIFTVLAIVFLPTLWWLGPMVVEPDRPLPRRVHWFCSAGLVVIAISFCWIAFAAERT